MKTQKVCSEACRRRRRARLAARRRREALERCRRDERDRQRRHRALKRAAAPPDAPAAAPRHAPASTEIPQEFWALLEHLVDSLAAVSRATLRRRIPEVTRAMARRMGQQGSPATPGHGPP